MSSIRLEEKPFELEGKTYILRCNMAVLDELQEAHGGDFGAVMELPPMQAVTEILAAMLNDYADEQGWPERWTSKQLRRKFSLTWINEQDILGLFTRGVIPAGTGSGEAAPEEPGN